MKSSKQFLNVDGLQRHFTSDFIVSSDANIRVFKSSTLIATFADLVVPNDYSFINNTIIFHKAPSKGSNITLNITSDTFDASVINSEIDLIMNYLQMALEAYLRALEAASRANQSALEAEASYASCVASFNVLTSIYNYLLSYKVTLDAKALEILNLFNSVTLSHSHLPDLLAAAQETSNVLLALVELIRISKFDAKLLNESTIDIIDTFYTETRKYLYYKYEGGPVYYVANIINLQPIGTPYITINYPSVVNNAYVNNTFTGIYPPGTNPDYTKTEQYLVPFVMYEMPLANENIYNSALTIYNTITPINNALSGITSQITTTNTSIDTFNTNLEARLKGPLSSDPVGASGMTVYNTTTDTFKCYLAGNWYGINNDSKGLYYKNLPTSEHVSDGSLYFNATNFSLDIKLQGEWYNSTLPTNQIPGNIIRDNLHVGLSTTAGTSYAWFDINAIYFISGTTPKNAYLYSSTNILLAINSVQILKFDTLGNIKTGLNMYGFKGIYATQSIGSFYVLNSTMLDPFNDNIYSFGKASNRFINIYATNAVIQTSDGRQKQQILSLTDKEKNVAIKLKSLIKIFKFNHAVAEDITKARLHTGVIAQEVKEAFESEGLVAENYSLFCNDIYEENNISINRYGIRYKELLLFIISNL